MASTNPLLTGLRATRCLADTQRGNRLATWELHVGSIRLYIVGPGHDCMHAVSDSYYSGIVGSAAERAIARRAVAVLNAEHHDDKDAGLPEIRAALARAAKLNSADS